MATGARALGIQAEYLSFSTVSELLEQQKKISDLLQLHEAVQKISSILDLDTLLDKIVNDVMLGFGCTEVGILLKDPESNELVLGAFSGCHVHQKGDRFTIGRDGLVGHVAATGKTYYAPDVDKEPAYIRCKASTRSELNIPLLLNNRLIGIFSIDHPSLDGFAPEKIEILETFATHISIAVENARIIQKERLVAHRLQKEQEEACRLQMRLMPQSMPAIDSLTVHAAFLPARAVGGDWYDYIALPDGRWSFVLADVSGKGMAAALLMASVRGILRSIAPSLASPDAVLESLNRVLVEDLPEDRFVTMILAVYDPDTRTLSLANAGHPWPLLVSPDSSRFLSEDSGIPLGIMDTKYPLTKFVLPPQSKLLFYTDGITEAENIAGDAFGMIRLEKALRQPGVTPDTIMQEVCRFTGGQCASDDATAVLLST